MMRFLKIVQLFEYLSDCSFLGEFHILIKRKKFLDYKTFPLYSLRSFANLYIHFMQVEHLSGNQPLSFTFTCM